jgi:alpha-beta hydrolase superfamily lysophospholipase
MGKVITWIVVVLVVLGAGAYGAREYATRLMNRRALTPKTLGATTPADAQLPFTRVAMESGDRTLIGWWVRARADSGRVAPAVLFLHGNRSSISDYVPLQRFLYRQGISSFVFDYSGFGASGGAPSLSNAIADAGVVARVFSDTAGPDARKVAMGTALGATILLQAIDSIQPHVSGVVIEGTDASIKEAAVRAGHLPERLAPLVQEIGDNVAAASRVRVPMLAVHSHADTRVPFADAERIVAAVPARVSLIRHWRPGHSGILTSSRPCDWAPVLSFIHSGALPAAKLDTTNACDVEAQQLAAQRPAADSAQRDVQPAGMTTTPRAVPAESSQTAPTRPATKTRPPARDAKRP